MHRFENPHQLQSDNYKPFNVGDGQNRLASSFYSTYRSPLMDSFPSGSPFSGLQLNNFTSSNSPPRRHLKLSGAGKKRLHKFLKLGMPYDKAVMYSRDPAFKGPSGSEHPQSKDLSQNPSFDNGPFNDFQDFVQFSMKNVELIPPSSHPERRSDFPKSNNTGMRRQGRNRRKIKSKSSCNGSGQGGKINNQPQVVASQKLTQAERKRAKNIRRRLRLRNEKFKNSQSNPSINKSSQVLVQNRQGTKFVGEALQKSEAVKNKPHIPVDKQQIEREVSLGIIPFDYPRGLFSAEQLSAIQKEILAKVALQKTETLKPRFKGIKTEKGVMVITCANEESASWLKSIEYSLGIQSGSKLKIVDKTPKTVRIRAQFPESKDDSSQFILELISGQNDDLKVDDWNVLDRKEEEGNTILIISVNEVSGDKLKSKDCINYKFGFAKVVVMKEEEEPNSKTL